MKCVGEVFRGTSITDHSLQPGDPLLAPWHPDSSQTSRRAREPSREINLDSPRYLEQREGLSHHMSHHHCYGNRGTITSLIYQYQLVMFFTFIPFNEHSC